MSNARRWLAFASGRVNGNHVSSREAPLPEWVQARQWAAPVGRAARGPCLTLVLDVESAT